jgi:hypothetical protein
MRWHSVCQQGYGRLDPLLLLALQRHHRRNGLRRSGRDRDFEAESQDGFDRDRCSRMFLRESPIAHFALSKITPCTVFG